MLAAIGPIFSFLCILFGQIFDAWNRARIAKEQFAMDEKKALEFIESSIATFRNKLSETNSTISDHDSHMDEILNNYRKPPAKI